MGVCRDSETISNGGVHIIQTYLANCEADAVQLIGRGARQGDPGSYEWIFFSDDLKSFGLTPQKLNQDIQSGMIIQTLNSARDQYYQKQVSHLMSKASKCSKRHANTQEFYNTLRKHTGSSSLLKGIQDRIMSLNETARVISTSNASAYHLYFCLDDSGSMSGPPWKDLENAVCGFIAKRVEMCQKNKTPCNDLVTIVNYSDSVSVLCKVEPVNKSPNWNNFLKYRGGGTDFSIGLAQVYQEMQTLQSGYVPVLLFMSDGECPTNCSGVTEIKQIANDFSINNVKIFTIGFGSGCDQEKLKHLADISNGQYFFGADGLSLKSEFESISVQISTTCYN